MRAPNTLRKRATSAVARNADYDAVLASLKDTARKAALALRHSGHDMTEKAAHLAHSAISAVLRAGSQLRSRARAERMTRSARRLIRRSAQTREQMRRAARMIVKEAMDRTKHLEPAQAARSAVRSALEAVEQAATEAAQQMRKTGERTLRNVRHAAARAASRRPSRR